MKKNFLVTVWRFSGVIGVVLAWVIIMLSISQNPWFNIFKHALSDLGDPKASSPWVYNLGLIVVGVIMCIYSLFYTYKAINKAHVYASALLFIAGVFLALIGVYPSSTRPHIFISTWFFIQTWLAFVVSTISMMLDKKIVYTIILSIITIVGPLGAILIKWPSVALLEIYGVILIDIYIITLTMYLK